MSQSISLKKVVKNQTKLTDLQIQIMELQEKEKALQNKISLNFSSFLQATDALIIPHDILVGGILNIVTSYKNNTQEIGEWQQAGATFLKKRNLLNQQKNLNLNLKKLHQTQIMLNRKISQISAINYKTAKAELSNRKARTRTLIQLGGLLSVSGLTTFFHIEEGDDLQGDMLTRDKATALLGLLAHTMETMNIPTDLSQWQQKGRRLLKRG